MMEFWAILGGVFFAGSCWVNAKSLSKLATAKELESRALMHLELAKSEAIEARVAYHAAESMAAQAKEDADIFRALHPELAE